MPVDRAVCYWCSINGRAVAECLVSPVDAVFDSICGHDECPSAVFHGLCLMEFRDDADTQEFRRRNNALIQWLRGRFHGEG